MLLNNKIKIRNKNILIVLIVFIFLLITMFPLLSFKYPVLVDYQNHLATYYIQANIDNDQWLKQNYMVKWTMTPYVLFEALGGWLVKYVDVFIAGKIIIGLGFILIILGVISIRRSLTGGIDLWIVTAFLFLYNHILFWGFLNYYIGSGIALIAMGAWIKLRNNGFFKQLLLFSVITTVLYFTHLFALALYGLFVTSYELGVYVYSRDKFSFSSCARAFSQFLLPLILFISWWASIKRPAGAGGGLYYYFGDFSSKIRALLSSASFDFSKSSLYLVIIILAFVLIARIFYPKGTGIYNNMKIPLWVFLIFSFIAPSSVMGVIMPDARISFIIIFLLIASVRFNDSERDMQYLKKYLVSVAFIALCFKIYLISDTWRKVGRQYDEFVEALQYVDQGSKVITVQERSNELENVLDPEFYRHMTALSVIKRSVFWSNIFTYLTPIYPTAKTKPIDSPSGPQLTLAALKDKKFKNGDPIGDGFRVYWENWLQDFDYLVSIRFEKMDVIEIKNLRLIVRGSFFDIYQIVH